jgi:hypothetical protein
LHLRAGARAPALACGARDLGHAVVATAHPATPCGRWTVPGPGWIVLDRRAVEKLHRTAPARKACSSPWCAPMRVFTRSPHSPTNPLANLIVSAG